MHPNNTQQFKQDHQPEKNITRKLLFRVNTSLYWSTKWKGNSSLWPYDNCNQWFLLKCVESRERERASVGLSGILNILRTPCHVDWFKSTDSRGSMIVLTVNILRTPYDVDWFKSTDTRGFDDCTYSEYSAYSVSRRLVQINRFMRIDVVYLQ